MGEWPSFSVEGPQVCPALAFSICHNPYSDQAGCGLGRGAGEFGEGLGTALPTAQRSWEGWAGPGSSEPGSVGRLPAEGQSLALEVQMELLGKECSDLL